MLQTNANTNEIYVGYNQYYPKSAKILKWFSLLWFQLTLEKFKIKPNHSFMHSTNVTAGSHTVSVLLLQGQWFGQDILDKHWYIFCWC